MTAEEFYHARYMNLENAPHYGTDHFQFARAYADYRLAQYRRDGMTAEETMKHSMNCGATGFDGYDVGECTCGLTWRIQLRTEQEMHAAWRKRAEEAEKELAEYRLRGRGARGGAS